jgi:hypothetical protein
MLGLRQLGQLLLVVLMVCVAMFVGFGIARLLDRNGNVAQLDRLTPQPVAATAVPTPDDGRRRSVLGSSDSDPTPTAFASTAPPPAASSTTAPPAASAAPDVTLILPPPPTGTPPRETGERFVDESFGSTASGWVDRDGATWSAQYVDGSYRLALDGQPSLNIAWPAPVSDFRLSADLSIVQGEAGIVFLAEKPATFYRIVLSDDGQYAVQVQQGVQTRNVLNWTPSDVLPRSANTTVRLRIERVGREVQFWVDDQPLAEWTIPSGEFLSHYGVAIASSDQQAEATFDNLVGEALQTPEAGATGG